MDNASGTIKKEDSPVLAAVGDIMLGENALCLGHGVGSMIGKRGANYPFLPVASALREGDIVFGNLETVLSGQKADDKSLHSRQMRAVPEAVEGLKYAGFNVLSLANNHALEHGREALTETMNTLAENGIKYIGVDSCITKAREPLVMHVKGVAIAFLAYCLVPDRTAYISTWDHGDICDDVRKAREKADIVVVSPHWGNEYIRRPSPAQIRLAHRIIDAGASLILGHHPHVLQGIEKYRGGIIAYSLGNFVFDMWQEKMRESMILKLRLSRTGITDMEVLPVQINDGYQPEILRSKSAGDLLSAIEDWSTKLTMDDLPGSGNGMHEYAAEAAACRSRYRRGLRWYFLTHLHWYPPGLTVQILKDYLLKTLSRTS